MSTIEVFTVEHVARLSGLSERQIEHWDRTDVFSPSLSRTSSNRPDSRIYSFSDLVILRALALVSNTASLQNLQAISSWLRKRTESDARWDQLSLLRDGETVQCHDSSGGAVTPGHGHRIELQPIVDDMRARAALLGQRAPTDIGQVRQHPDVVHNAPVLAGTRIPTRAIWDFHLAGYTTEGNLSEYPALTDEDVAVAIEFERSPQHAVR